MAAMLLSAIYSAYAANNLVNNQADSYGYKLKKLLFYNFEKNGLPTHKIIVHVYKKDVQLCGFLTKRQIKMTEKIARQLTANGKLKNNLIPTDSIKTKLFTNVNSEAILRAEVAVSKEIQRLTNEIHSPDPVSAQTFHGTAEICGYVNKQSDKEMAGHQVGEINNINKVYNNIIVINS
jgi:osmotically-inducible protein OsmY